MRWGEATRGEIFDYYNSEFPEYIHALPDHITPDGPVEYAIAFREQYPVSADDPPGKSFIRRGTRIKQENAEDISVFDDWNDLCRFIQDPAGNEPLDRTNGKALADPDLVVEHARPVPAAVYYGTVNWDRSWPTVVDIDAKDIALERTRSNVQQDDGESKRDYLARAGVTESPPEEYPYAFEDIDRSLEYAFDVAGVFERTLNAEETLVVYSGQGAHVYLLDDDRSHHYDAESHQVIVDFLEHEYGFPIDPVVTADRSRVIRLPYSLHSDVSRIVTPIESPDFDYLQAAQPGFIGEETDQ
jgi:hypothetical protein